MFQVDAIDPCVDVALAASNHKAVVLQAQEHNGGQEAEDALQLSQPLLGQGAVRAL